MLSPRGLHRKSLSPWNDAGLAFGDGVRGPCVLAETNIHLADRLVCVAMAEIDVFQRLQETLNSDNSKWLNAFNRLHTTTESGVHFGDQADSGETTSRLTTSWSRTVENDFEKKLCRILWTGLRPSLGFDPSRDNKGDR